MTNMENENMENENTESKNGTGLPEAVHKRLSKHAERTKQSLDDVMTEYFTFIKAFGCEDWRDEDDDLLEDWAEQMLVVLRTSTGSRGMDGAISFVGCFVGVDQNQRDRREFLVSRARREFTLDANAAIGGGQVGHYTKGETHWVLTTSDGDSTTDIPVAEVPEHSFLSDGERICLLARSRRPKAMSMMGRHYYFLGAAEDDFTKDGAIRLWRLDCQGEDANMEVPVGRPCRIQARPPGENTNEAYRDVLSVSMGMREQIEWTDNFVPEDMRALLHPYKYWLNNELHGLSVSLDMLMEAYEANSRTFTTNSGEQGRSGPIVFVKGTVNRMSTEGRESEYDQTGRSYSLSLTSTALQSGATGDASEVMCWVSGACHDLTNPFVAYTDEDAVPYAERSTVLVCGRIGVRRKDGDEIPNLKVMGVFADPRRIRRREEGGDTGRGQFQ
jgi:hypothetical protein